VPEHHPAILYRDRELRLRQRGPDMGRHIVRALVIVRVERPVLGRDPGEEFFEIVARGPGRILLDEQGRRSVRAEERQQSVADCLRVKPMLNVRSDFVEAASWRPHLKRADFLLKHLAT